MDLWQTLAAAVLGNAIVLAVLGWLGKSLLEKLIQRDSKQFEIELKAKVDTTLEQFKNELQLRSIEHQIKLSRLHERRATVIAELNALLAEVMWEAESFLSLMEFAGEPSKQEKHQATMNKLTEFFRYFDKNRIYLPQKLCETTEKIVLEVRQHVIKFGVYLHWEDAALMDHTRKEKNDAWIGGWNAIKNQIPAVRVELENEFLLLLDPNS
ncbi:MAG: hypothetical protein H7Z20_01830 [Bdellovibrio sp.]|nr:hypothetical protein [Methylotenera sp.]